MSAKEIEVTCPCCSAHLTVDAATGNVMRSKRAADRESGVPSADRWDSAQERVRQRTSTGADKLESALESERGKADRLDELFRQAQAKQRRGDSDETREP